MCRLIINICVILLTPILLSGQNIPFKPGEKVQYSINYGPIIAGNATLQLNNDTLNLKDVWHASLSARTTGIADALFKVRDTYACYVEPASGLPLKSIRDIQEGRYTKYNVVLFDHITRKDSAILMSDLTGKHVTVAGIHDIISCFYHFRKHYLSRGVKFRKGDMITIITWFTDELYPIRLRYLGTEDVRTRFGKIKCLKFNPVTETGRLFKTEEDMTIWFSDDPNALPVKIRFEIFVGAFTVEAVSFEGLAN
jgi:hypothetical protein